jgi:hypothetical protein
MLHHLEFVCNARQTVFYQLTFSMQKFALFFSGRRSILGAMGAALLLLSGCDLTVKNLTPPTFSENPSQTYSITLQVNKRSGVVLSGSIQPNVVIDGQIFPMEASTLGEDIYEFDYRLPSGRQNGAYYFLINYEVNAGSGPKARDDYTELYEFKVVNRYALTLEVNRAPVGAKVSVLGRGFTPSDKVMVGGMPAETNFESSTSLSFYVPAVAAGQNHPVTLSSGLDVGTIRVDPATVRVIPSSLDLAQGESGMLIFQIPAPAPAGGMLINVTTDAPASVVMPQVIIPAGDQSVNVSVQGGQPGSGSLFISVSGQSEIIVPITVR